MGILSDTTIKCRTTIEGKDAEISYDIKECRAKPSITFGIKVDALNVDWTKTFEDSVEVRIPGFSVLGLFGVNLRVEMRDKNNGNVYLKVRTF